MQKMKDAFITRWLIIDEFLCKCASFQELQPGDGLCCLGVVFHKGGLSAVNRVCLEAGTTVVPMQFE